jgi:hypothetical protein
LHIIEARRAVERRFTTLASSGPKAGPPGGNLFRRFLHGRMSDWRGNQQCRLAIRSRRYLRKPRFPLGKLGLTVIPNIVEVNILLIPPLATASAAGHPG